MSWVLTLTRMLVCLKSKLRQARLLYFGLCMGLLFRCLFFYWLPQPIMWPVAKTATGSTICITTRDQMENLKIVSLLTILGSLSNTILKTTAYPVLMTLPCYICLDLFIKTPILLYSPLVGIWPFRKSRYQAILEIKCLSLDRCNILLGSIHRRVQLSALILSRQNINYRHAKAAVEVRF